jgi:hypothetical protein
MKKMPTIFQRDWSGDRSRVVDTPHPDCAWVFAGEGKATMKLDGTCCLVKDDKLFKRREVKSGRPAPAGFVLADTDAVTGTMIGWVPVGVGPEDRYHREAFDDLTENRTVLDIPEGTYELLGPNIQGNPENFKRHILYKHASAPVFAPDPPTSFKDLQQWMIGEDIEGIVWHHPDGRMAKIKLYDFGLDRVNYRKPTELLSAAA